MMVTKKATKSLSCDGIRILALGWKAMRKEGTHMAEKSAREWMTPAPLSPVGQAAWKCHGQFHIEHGCRQDLHSSAILQRTSNLHSLQVETVQ